MIVRKYYRLPVLAERWGCTVDDLLHMGIYGRAQICVNIYGKVGLDSIPYRVILHDRGTVPKDMPKAGEKHRVVPMIRNAVSEFWMSRTTKNMPPGVYEIISHDVRVLEMPGNISHTLYKAMRFDGGWYQYEFDPPVMITLDDLCILHEEVQRLERLFPDVAARIDGELSEIAAPHPQIETPDVQTPQQGRRMKKAAMIKELERDWPTIEADLREASRSTNQDLKAANVGHGMWDVEVALQWAVSRGKTKKRATQSGASSPFARLVRN